MRRSVVLLLAALAAGCGSSGQTHSAGTSPNPVTSQHRAAPNKTAAQNASTAPRSARTTSFATSRVWTDHFDGWSVRTSRDVLRPTAGQLVTFALTLVPPASGSFSMTVQWGDQMASLNPNRSNCMYGMAVRKGRSFRLAFQHAWRVDRTYRLTLQPTVGCPSGRTPRYPTHLLPVQPGPLLDNGPQRPWARVDYGGADSGDYRKGDAFTAQAVDNDGYVARFIFDWGDGSRPTTMDFLSQCRRPPDDAWIEHPNTANDVRHKYARDPSAYTISLTVVSSGCHGEDGQRTVVRWRPTRIESGPYISPEPRP
ncbi:MAG: hypothetical protein ACJ735_08985 [Actinomycetes bacterium]